MLKKIKNYLTGVKEEVRKVSFPSKQETKDMTSLVVVLSLALSLYISLLDYGFSSFTKWLISK